MSLSLYEMNFDCGRMGCIEGLFVAEKGQVLSAIGKELHFGEVLGKHSDISGPLANDDLKIVSQDAEKIDWLVTVMGGFTISGYNPLDYIEEDEEE